MLADGSIYNSSSTGKDSFYIKSTPPAVKNHNININDNINSECTETVHSDNYVTPGVKKPKTKSYTNPEFIRSPAVDQRTLNEINNFIKRRVVEELLPFTDEMNNILDSYKAMNAENIRLTNENQNLGKKGDEVIRLEKDVAFLKSEILTKNELIKILLTSEKSSEIVPSEGNRFEKVKQTHDIDIQHTSSFESANRFETLAGYGDDRNEFTLKNTQLENNRKKSRPAF